MDWSPAAIVRDEPPHAAAAPCEPVLHTIAPEVDSAFYLARNPDVARAGMAAAEHYWRMGWREGRDPSPWFRTEYYLRANPDVAAAGINPLWHFLVRGRAEGRPPSEPGGAWREELDRPRPPPAPATTAARPLSDAALRRLLRLACADAPDLVLSVSHDRYTNVPGGTQRLIADEQRKFNADRAAYLHLVSGMWRRGLAMMALRGVRWPPDPARGGRRPSALWSQPRESFGTGRRGVTHNRTVARLPVAWTRQVTVAKTFCGVDVSSTTLDARIGHADGPSQRFARSTDGIAALAEFCRTHAVDLVVMEATGGYEKLPFGLLWAAGIAVAIVNARAVRRFAEAMGLLEKTDRIDAGVIAWYAAVKHLAGQPPASQTQQRLAAWVTRLRQLTELRVRQTNQRRLIDDPVVLASIDAIIALLNQQIRRFEADIARIIAADPLWARLDAAFRSIKGVAGRTVARLMAEMPEIGTLSGKAAAKLAGLAPIAHDSGKRTGKRPVRAGRAGVRSVLFVVAEIVRRYDPDFAAFHHRLAAAGKPKKLIRIALAHKLLTRLNAKARDVRNECAAAA